MSNGHDPQIQITSIGGVAPFQITGYLGEGAPARRLPP
jgi:hypothetical protein